MYPQHFQTEIKNKLNAVASRNQLDFLHARCIDSDCILYSVYVGMTKGSIATRKNKHLRLW